MDKTYEPIGNKPGEKIKVDSIDTIVTTHGDKPYYENKYVLKVNIMAKRTISRRAKRAKPKDNKIYFSKEWQNGSNEIYRKAEKSDNLRD